MTGHTPETHKRIRKHQALNLDTYHHPIEKIEQLKKFNFNNLKILEVFAGKGNLTKYYKSISKKVVAMSKETTGDSFDYIYKVEASQVVSFRVKQLTPEKDKKEVFLEPQAWVQAMELLQDRHNLVCRKRDAA